MRGAARRSDAGAGASAAGSGRDPSGERDAGAVPDRHPGRAGATAAALAAAQNLVACVNAARFEAVAALATPYFLRTAVGVTDLDEAASAVAFFPFAVESMGDVRAHDDGRVSLDVVYRREDGQHMLVHERWYFVDRDGTLLIDALQPLAIVPDEPFVEVEIRRDERGVGLSQDRVVAGEAIVFRVAQAADALSGFAVFRVPDGAEAGDPRVGTILEEEGRFMGAAAAGPGGAVADLVLIDLEPGTYVIVSAVGAAEGRSDTPRPIVARFIVEG